MNVEFNYFWGLTGFLGILGYVLENPAYYVFFAFFMLFLIPVYNKNAKTEEKTVKKKSDADSNYNIYKVSIWLGSAALIVDSIVLIIWKTMDDFIAIGLLLGITVYMASFFAYLGMDKTARDERLRKIGTLAATWSWYITLVFVVFLVISMYWAQRIHDPIELMGVTIFVMVTTMLIANTILSRRGDIE
jgi:L-asparagine transporter-like permease